LRHIVRYAIKGVETSIFLHSAITINNLLLKINHLLFCPDLHDLSRILFLELILKEADVTADVLPAIAKFGQSCFEHFKHALSWHYLILTATTPKRVCFEILNPFFAYIIITTKINYVH